MTWWHIYLFTRLDSLIAVTAVGAGLLGGFYILFVITSFVYEGQNTSYDKDIEIRNKLKAKIPKFTCMYMAYLFVMILIPSQKEAAVIYFLPKVVNSDAMKEAEKIPKNVSVLLNAKCQKYINDTLVDTVSETKELKK